MRIKVEDQVVSTDGHKGEVEEIVTNKHGTFYKVICEAAPKKAPKVIRFPEKMLSLGEPKKKIEVPK